MADLKTIILLNSAGAAMTAIHAVQTGYLVEIQKKKKKKKRKRKKRSYRYRYQLSILYERFEWHLRELNDEWMKLKFKLV